jgi:hypothetical protein
MKKMAILLAALLMSTAAHASATGTWLQGNPCDLSSIEGWRDILNKIKLGEIRQFTDEDRIYLDEQRESGFYFVWRNQSKVCQWIRGSDSPYNR